jgi:hypothetical protein
LSEVTGIDVAIGRHAGRTLHRLDYNKPVTVGLLAGFDHYYNEGAPRIQKMGMGGKLLFDWLFNSPEWAGVDGLDPDYQNRRLNIVKTMTAVQGKLLPSSCQMGEPVDKYELNQLMKEPDAGGQSPYKNWIKKVGRVIADKYLKLVDDQLFPAVNQVGGSQAYGPTKQRIMSFAYPLQSGYAGNEASGSGTYNYLGVDLNQRPELKAINAGDDTTGWTVSEENLQTDFIMPLRAIGANVDMAMCDKATYSYLRSQLMSMIQQRPERVIRYPGPKFVIDEGIWFIYEPKLDALYDATGKREMYIGDSSTLKFGWDGSEDTGIEFIETWQEQPSAHLFQGYKEHAFVNERPSYWGRGYDVQIPS